MTGGYASAINDSGEVAGRTDDQSPPCATPGSTLAFVGDENSITYLPIPAGFRSDAFAINKHGTVGGTVWVNDEAHAAIWERH